MIPTIERLRELFTVSDDGELIRILRVNSARLGPIRRSFNAKGYLRVQIGGSLYLAHRVIYAVIHGEWPQRHVDHIDGNKLNNRRANLRLATPSQNLYNRGSQRNNRLGVKGVCFDRRRGRYFAQIAARGKHHFLGYFHTLDEASSAYRVASARIHGEFARHA
jgi:hypothetical protein